MVNENNPPPGGQEAVVVEPEHPLLMDPPGRQLETLRDVRKALAAVCRRIERGTIDYKAGQVLLVGLNMLGNHMRDERDSKWLPRVRQLWAERAGQKQPEAH